MVTHSQGPVSGGCALLLLLLAATLAEAQVRVVRGERIRASGGERTVVGTVVAMSDSSLVLRRERASGLDTIPFRSLAWVDVSQGRRSSTWLIVAGGLVGMMAGGLIDGSTTASSSDDGSESARAAGWPSLVGLVAGAYIGSRIKSDRWRHAVLPAGPGALAETTAPSADELDATAPALGPFTPGAHIRYALSGGGQARYTARVIRLRGDTLIVRLDGATSAAAVPLASVRRFELSDGWHRHTARGALIGALAGMTAGTAIAAVTFHQSDDQGDPFANMWNGLAAAWTGLLLGTTVGGGVGAAIGYADYDEHWRSQALPLALTVQPRGRVALAVRLGGSGAR